MTLLKPLEGYEWAALDKEFYNNVDDLPIGITFMIRAKNEEERIENAISSIYERLHGKIAFNVVLIDNGSTDKTVKIAKENLKGEKDKVVHYPIQVAKAGLETYVTSCNSAHSLPWFYQFCLQQCGQFSHVFKWDADFRLSDTLAARLIGEFAPESGDAKPFGRYEIFAEHQDGVFGCETYILGLQTHYCYYRCFLWESWWTRRGCTCKKFEKTEAIVHDSLLEKPKSYVALPPWWQSLSSDMQNMEHVLKAKNKYNEWKEKLPAGTQLFCRSCDPNCETIQRQLPRDKSGIKGI